MPDRETVLLYKFESFFRVFFTVFRSQAWIEEQHMGAFLSVSKGSEEPPVFLELHYNGSPDSTQAPMLLVGKGITFDR